MLSFYPEYDTWQCDIHRNTRTVEWYDLTQAAKHKNHLRTTNQKADRISEFLLLSTQILPSIINLKKRNMMGSVQEEGGGCQHRPRLHRRSQDTKRSLPALPVCLCRSPSERKEKSNYRAPKDLIIGWVSFACVRAAQQDSTWGRPFCAWCVTVQSLIATFRNDQIKCLASLTAYVACGWSLQSQQPSAVAAIWKRSYRWIYSN